MEMVKQLTANQATLMEAFQQQASSLAQLPVATASSTPVIHTVQALDPTTLQLASAAGFSQALREQEARHRQPKQIPDELGQSLDKLDRTFSQDAARYVRAQARLDKTTNRCKLLDDPNKDGECPSGVKPFSLNEKADEFEKRCRCV